MGVPLFCIIAAVSINAFVHEGIDVSAIIIEMVRLASAPMLLAIPMFTFTGYLLAESKAPQRMVNFTHALFGWLPGGVPIVVLLSCAFFTAFTGASGVTILALGTLLYPILISQQYAENFSMGLITCSGSVGLLLPPSLPLILYGVVSETRIDQLFLAGIIPNVLLVILLSIFSIKHGLKQESKRSPFSLSELIKSTKEAAFEIPLPIIILAGIYTGSFTATEAAAISALYVLIVETLIYRDLSWKKDVPEIMQKSLVLVGGILIILGAALGMTNYFIDAQIPMRLLGWMQQYITSKWAFLMLLNFFLLIVGSLLDIFSAIIVVVPLIKPIAAHFDVNPVHLGIIFLCNLEIGYLTPPIGLNLFIASSCFNRSITDLYKVSLPFIGILIIGLLLITYVPWISLALQALFMGNS